MISYNTFWSYLSLSFSPVYHTGDGAGGHLSFVIDATDGPVVCRVKKSEKQRGGAAGANDGGRGVNVNALNMICLPHSPWPSISFGLLILGRDLFLRRLVMRYDVVSLLATIKRHNNNNSKKTKKKKNKFNNKNQRLLCYHISILYMVLGACKSCLCLLFFVLSCPLDGNGRSTEYEKLFCQALLTPPPLL